MDDTPQEITALVGREVYSKGGVYVGEIEDVRLDLDTEIVTGLALRQTNGDLFAGIEAGARGFIIPYRWVQAVGDIVLINDVVERIRRPEDEEEAVA